MLSLKRCRELLGELAPSSDGDLEELRDEIYGMARYVLDSWEQDSPLSSTALKETDEEP